MEQVPLFYFSKRVDGQPLLAPANLALDLLTLPFQVICSIIPECTLFEDVPQPPGLEATYQGFSVAFPPTSEYPGYTTPVRVNLQFSNSHSLPASAHVTLQITGPLEEVDFQEIPLTYEIPANATLHVEEYLFDAPPLEVTFGRYSVIAFSDDLSPSPINFLSSPKEGMVRALGLFPSTPSASGGETVILTLRVQNTSPELSNGQVTIEISRDEEVIDFLPLTVEIEGNTVNDLVTDYVVPSEAGLYKMRLVPGSYINESPGWSLTVTS